LNPEALVPVIFEHRQNVTADTVCANIRANAGRPLPSLVLKRVCVCASGPSLASSLPAIRKRIELGFSVAAMNGSYRFLVENGIVPDYFFMVDARAGLNLPFVAKPDASTTFFIASQCDPEIFEALTGANVVIWQVGNASYEGAEAAIREVDPKATIFGGACNVGHSCLNGLVALGYRVMHLYGFDGPTRNGEKHAFRQPQNDGDAKIEFTFKGERFLGSATSAHDAQAFVARWRMLSNMGIDVQVYGDSLLPAMVMDAAQNDAMRIEPRRVPAPLPRQPGNDRLQVVCWKWKGHIPYTADHVNTLAAMVSRWLSIPHDMVCITDDAEGIDPSIRVIPMWMEGFEHGRDWHRLKVFSPVMAKVIGPRFVSLDLDTVICGPVDHLFAHDAPFKAWKDPNRDNQYCTAMFQMDTGAYPHVLDEFTPEKALALRHSGKFTGYDQAWVSEALPGMPMWTAADGVLSFRRDVLHDRIIEPGDTYGLPSNACMVHFHGRYDPHSPEVRASCPWVPEFYVSPTSTRERYAA
jgi:hypothetical protein